MIQHTYRCNLSLSGRGAERETGEAAAEHAPGNQIITGKFVLGGGFCCPSRSHDEEGQSGGGREDGEGRLNVTLALICHIVSHRYEENASRLNVRGET